MDGIMTSQLSHMVGAQVDRHMIRDGVTHCRGNICPTPEYTLREMIRRELHDTPLVGHFEALYEHGAQWMVGLFYRRAYGLQAVIGYCCRTDCLGSATMLRPGVVTLIPDLSI